VTSTRWLGARYGTLIFYSDPQASCLPHWWMQVESVNHRGTFASTHRADARAISRNLEPCASRAPTL
jgi:hypothetical protein